MRWVKGFSSTRESFAANYKRATDAAGKYGVEGIVIWGFLRDRHGGIDAAREVVEYAGNKGVAVLPGVGIDDYGGVYYQGDSPYSLDTYIRAHPEAQARNEDGTPQVHRWPPTDTDARLKACPSDERVVEFYCTSLAWLVETFGLEGFQIEQGDSGVCFCERCRARDRRIMTLDHDDKPRISLEDAAVRIPAVVEAVLPQRGDCTIITETYSGLLPRQIEQMAPFVEKYPDDFYISWQLYDGVGRFKVDDESRSPSPHGCAALRTNNDRSGGEVDDRENIGRALDLSRKAGLDMTYIYGEYADDRAVTRGNYDAWSEGAGGGSNR